MYSALLSGIRLFPCRLTAVGSNTFDPYGLTLKMKRPAHNKIAHPHLNELNTRNPSS